MILKTMVCEAVLIHKCCFKYTIEKSFYIVRITHIVNYYLQFKWEGEQIIQHTFPTWKQNSGDLICKEWRAWNV